MKPTTTNPNELEPTPEEAAQEVVWIVMRVAIIIVLFILTLAFAGAVALILMEICD